MIKVNSISGGKTSAFIAMNYPADYNVFALVCIDDPACKPKDRFIVDYINKKLTKFIPEYGEFIATAEDDQTLYAMMDLEQLLGTEVTWLRGKSFDDVIDTGTQTRLPSWARRYCTSQMKMQPIFDWWFNEFGEKCEMRIGFRFDEFSRMERFFNNSDPTNYAIPVSCSIRGKRLQQHQTFNWRYCSFPLIKDGIQKHHVQDYWKNNGWVGGNLFEERRQIKFPSISNCVGCFHKSVETIAAEFILNPEKMKWFARQEQKDMGTWFDSLQTYEEISQKAHEIAKEVLFEMKFGGDSCDTGGCTD